jgi:hypothetical protein
MEGMERNELLQTKGADEIASLLDAKDVAKILKSSVKTVHKRVREGKLGCVQITAKDRRFTIEQVRTFIEAQSTRTPIDKKVVNPILSSPKKGGEINGAHIEKAKDSWASLQQEMSQWM